MGDACLLAQTRVAPKERVTKRPAFIVCEAGSIAKVSNGHS